MNSLTSLLGLTTHPKTGQVTLVKVCAHCEKENQETLFVQAFARHHNAALSHGICPAHYKREMERMGLGA